MTFGDPPATPPDSNRLQPPLQPPGTGTGGPRDGPRTGRGVWLALTILALLVLGVVFLLPQQVAEKVPPPASVPLSAPPVAQPAGDQDNARRQAEQTLQQYLRLQAEVRLIRGDEWATVAWDAAARHATTGDRLFGERRFDEAGEAYAQALARLERLAFSALTVAELAAAGVGSILVPFPHATDDHQTGNARYLADAGAALLMPQKQLSGIDDQIDEMVKQGRAPAWIRDNIVITDDPKTVTDVYRDRLHLF